VPVESIPLDRDALRPNVQLANYLNCINHPTNQPSNSHPRPHSPTFHQLHYKATTTIDRRLSLRGTVVVVRAPALSLTPPLRPPPSPRTEHPALTEGVFGRGDRPVEPDEAGEEGLFEAYLLLLE
jgi:hypothetical protein